LKIIPLTAKGGYSMGTANVIPLSSRERKRGSRSLSDKGGRRSGLDRRKQSCGPMVNDRRVGPERRSGRDRRCFRGFEPRKIEERRRVFLKTVFYSLFAKHATRNAN
jgi:hypothetical protein